MSKLISVIIPVYNTAEYLDKCLESISNQTYENLELIVVDDGSTDDSPRICDEWAGKDKRFNIIHQKNAGQSAARNKGIDVAKGDYLAFVDSDDYVSEDYMLKLYETLQQNDADISVCAYYEHKDGQTRVLGPVDNYSMDRNMALEKLVENKEFQSFFWTCLFKKELFNDVRLPVGRNYEDLAVIYKLFYNAQKVCSTNEPLYHYQKRVGSMSYNDATAEVWHEKCHFNVTSQVERTEFFKEKGLENLSERSLYESVPYIYSDILTGYQTGNLSDVNECRSYLRKNKKEIRRNPYISRKNKLLYHVYAADEFLFKAIFRQKLKK